MYTLTTYTGKGGEETCAINSLSVAAEMLVDARENETLRRRGDKFSVTDADGFIVPASELRAALFARINEYLPE